jgi:hypothetical protein
MMTRREAVYVRLLDRVSGIDIWRVDGHRIRNHLDVEFTNGHHHFTRKYIPKREIWLDRDAPGAGEWTLWALRQLVERQEMARGVDYLRALGKAAHMERVERRRALGLKKRPEIRDIQRAARRRHLGMVGGREVWLVDGKAVRDLAYVDFTLGGHGYRYRFIPKREIWLDDAMGVPERPAVLHHEAVEVDHMARGMKYVPAHDLASAAERRYRRAHALKLAL